MILGIALPSRTLIGWQRSGVSIDEHIAALSAYLGHISPADTYWYLSASPELMGLGRRAAARPVRTDAMSALAPALQAYFTQRLVGQRAASPNTIAAYRVTFCLLLGFAAQRTGKAPSKLDIADLDAPLIAAFLDHLEHDRHNGRPPATTASPRSTRCSATSPCTIPSTRRRSSACSPSRRSGPSATWSPTSPRRRSTRCLTPATRPRGPGGATTPCSRSPSRPDYASPSSPGSPARTSPSPPAPTCTPSAKAARNGERRSCRPSEPSSRAWLDERRGAPGRSAVPHLHRHDASAATPSSGASPSTCAGAGASCPSLASQARHHAHAAPHRGHAPAARRQRHHRDRAMARTRTDLNDQHLPARRHDP